MHNFQPTTDNVKHLGRTWNDSSILWSSLSGTGISFSTDANNLSITFIGDTSSVKRKGLSYKDLPKASPLYLPPESSYARIAIYVNGERFTEFLLDEAIFTLQIFPHKNIYPGINTVEVIKLSESLWSMMGIASININDWATIKPGINKKHRFEFIGDSITCGYGVDDTQDSVTFSTAQQDCTKSYAFRIAQILQSEWSFVSYSGFGILSGHTNDPTQKNEIRRLPPYYDKVGFSNGKFPVNQNKNEYSSIAEIEWDFSKYIPDLIIINLGTNDDSFCNGDPQIEAQFTKEYEDFLKVVREKNPDAVIFCVLGIMLDNLYPAIEQAVTNFINYQNAKGINESKKVFAIHLPLQEISDGTVLCGHPTSITHQKEAEFLAAAIIQKLG